MVIRRPSDDLSVLDQVQGILFAGGGEDIDPRRYGCEPHPKTTPPDDARDCFELALAKAALERGIPMLGICRGAQLLGVALSGQLVQDIGSNLLDAQEHISSDAGRVAEHWIVLASGSRLAEVIGSERILVNSFHHQANSLLGPGVLRAAWSDDGVTEAIELGTGFVLGVQWHPERMLDVSSSHRLFDNFIGECRNYRSQQEA